MLVYVRRGDGPPQPLTATARQREELAEHVRNTHVGDGYNTGAQDPLLTAYCAVFRVNVVLELARHGCFSFEVENPRRTVTLSASVGHMEHAENSTPR